MRPRRCLIHALAAGLLLAAGIAHAVDNDFDNVDDAVDNCPDFNPDQNDSDCDGLGDICDFVVNNVCRVAPASVFDGLGGRDLDGEPRTLEAWYAPELNVTFHGDANLPKQLPGAIGGIDAATGGLDWATANAWIASLNALNGGAGLLNVNTWRLPNTDPINGTAFDATFSNDARTDVGTAALDKGWGWLSAGPSAGVSELGFLYYVIKGALGRCTPNGFSPGSCVDQPGYGLTGTGPFRGLEPALNTDPDAGPFWWFGDAPAGSVDALNFDMQEGRQRITTRTPAETSHRAWPVADGAVGTAVTTWRWNDPTFWPGGLVPEAGDGVALGNTTGMNEGAIIDGGIGTVALEDLTVDASANAIGLHLFDSGGLTTAEALAVAADGGISVIGPAASLTHTGASLELLGLLTVAAGANAVLDLADDGDGSFTFGPATAVTVSGAGSTLTINDDTAGTASTVIDGAWQLTDGAVLLWGDPHDTEAPATQWQLLPTFDGLFAGDGTGAAFEIVFEQVVLAGNWTVEDGAQTEFAITADAGDGNVILDTTGWTLEVNDADTEALYDVMYSGAGSGQLNVGGSWVVTEGGRIEFVTGADSGGSTLIDTAGWILDVAGTGSDVDVSASAVSQATLAGEWAFTDGALVDVVIGGSSSGGTVLYPAAYERTVSGSATAATTTMTSTAAVTFSGTWDVLAAATDSVMVTSELGGSSVFIDEDLEHTTDAASATFTFDVDDSVELAGQLAVQNGGQLTLTLPVTAGAEFVQTPDSTITVNGGGAVLQLRFEGTGGFDLGQGSIEIRGGGKLISQDDGGGNI